MEADDGCRRALDRAAAATIAANPDWGPPDGGPPSPRFAREARAHEARLAVAGLVAQGLLTSDGPGRVRLPGFGASTWRALDILRDGSGPLAWAAALAREPAADLGEAAPAFATGLADDPGMREPARRVHALEALRQDLRHVLLTAQANHAKAVERDNPAGAAALEEEAGEASRRIALCDRLLEEAWSQGVARSVGAGP